MIRPVLFARMRKARILVVLLAMLLAYGVVSYSPQADVPLNSYSVDMGGVTGAANNTVLAFGRFLLVAPFAPSKGVDENGYLDLDQLDNYSIHVIDTKRPNAPVQSKDLTFWDSQLQVAMKVFFPTKLVFEPISSTVYVRGTRYEQKDEDITAIDVVAYVHINLDPDSGKPLFDNVVVVDIPGVSAALTNEAPLDFGLGWNGNLLVFTNGATVFSMNVISGELNRAEIVPPSLYGSDNNISFLQVDQATNLVSACWSTKAVGKDNVPKFSSEVSFYQLDEKGRFNLTMRIYPDQFPDGTALAPGSNIAIVSDPDNRVANLGLFVTNDGSLWQVDFDSDEVSTRAMRLYTFPELGTSSASDLSPLIIHYDSSKRVVGIVKPGFTLQISRPVNGKGGRISRPVNIHLASSSPALAIAKLSKKNKVTFSATFGDVFKEEGGLSNFVIGQDSQWLISTYSGKLYSVGIGGDLQDSTLQFIGSLGSRVDRFDYYADHTSVVAISAFTLDEDGIRIASPGSLVFGQMSDLQSQPGSIVQAFLPTASVLGRSTPTIRRPCNIRR